MFTNYVTNAMKFTEAGEVVMGYEYVEGHIKGYVRDTGVGIDDEKKKRLFNRFEKLNDFAQGPLWMPAKAWALDFLFAKPW